MPIALKIASGSAFLHPKRLYLTGKFIDLYIWSPEWKRRERRICHARRYFVPYKCPEGYIYCKFCSYFVTRFRRRI